VSFDVPEHVRPIREKVRRFVEERVYPAEAVLDRGDDESVRPRCGSWTRRRRRTWALGHPREIGGGGLPFLDYVYVNEIVGPCRARDGRARHPLAPGLDHAELHAVAEWRDRYLRPSSRARCSRASR
jgi:alkylation response protein AidB-like acyl-CoA dehydrogenase